MKTKISELQKSIALNKDSIRQEINRKECSFKKIRRLAQEVLDKKNELTNLTRGLK